MGRIALNHELAMKISMEIEEWRFSIVNQRNGARRGMANDQLSPLRQ